MPFHRQPYFRLCAALALALSLTLLLVGRPTKMEHRIEERRLTLGKEPPTHWLVPVWSWRALAINTGLAVLLAGLTPLAGRKIPTSSGEPTAPQPLSRTDLLLTAAAVVVFLSAAVPRMTHSLWGDEEWVMRKLIAPQAERQPDGTVQLTPTPWSETIWEFDRPTNHIGFTVLARASHDLFFRPGDGPNDPFFSEAAMRLPSLLAGLGSLFALLWCARVWGMTRFLGAVVLLHALHPWVTRFGSDARGYGLVLLLMPLLLGCVGRGVQTGKWRWWLLLTFVQFYLVWTHLSAVIAVAATELAAFIFILKQPRERRAGLLGRWAAANLLSGMVFLQLFAPCLPGFLHFLSQNVLAGELDKPWFQDSAAALWSSFNFYDADPGNPLSLCLTTHPLPSGLGVAFVICGWLTAALGSWRLARDPARWPLLITLLGGPALLLADLLHSHTRPYTWYWVLFQPWLLLLVLAAMQPAPQGSGRSWRQLTTGLMVVNFVGMALLSLPALRNMARYPIEGCRESVALTRPITNPRHPGFGLDALTAAPGMTTRAYDPAEIDDLTPESLRALIAQARAENKPLYLNFGFPSMLRRTCPEMFQIIDDPTLFEHVATLHGQFFTTTREVWQLRQPTPSTPFPAPKPDSKD